MFKDFSIAVNKRLQDFAELDLFKVDTLDIFASYLAAFPEGTNPIFRERTEHDCNCCKQFIRNLGNVVAIVDGEIWTVWDNHAGLPYPYDVVSKAMADLVRQSPIRSAYKTKEPKFGTGSNRDNHDASIVWNHFHGEVPKKAKSRQPDTDRGKIDTMAQVFKRGLNEIALADLDTIVDLIEANNLYRGQEHLASVKAFRELKQAYNTAGQTDRFVWENISNRNAGFRNTVIGTLLVDLADTADLEGAVKRFEAKVAPSNYKRPKALITPKMIEQAVEKLNELGLDGAVERRFARIEDVSVTDVLFVDNSVRSKMKGGLTDLLMGSDKVKLAKVADKPTPITFDAFMALGASEISLVLSNSQLGNFVSLTAPQHADTGKLFKWNNDFAWSYDGEVADSMRQRVAEAGGRVDGPFRFTHSWNHEGRRNASLMDLHVYFPGFPMPVNGSQSSPYGRGRGRGSRIGWDMRSDGLTGGSQDVDYTNAAPVGYIPVENIAFPDVKRMPEGTYNCFIHNWSLRQPNDGGFKAQIELNGTIYDYDYPSPVKKFEWVHVAAVTLKNGEFTIEHKLPSSATSRDKWGVPTLKPVKVDTIMLSPNYWDGAGSVGNKHVFFMLDGCKNPDPARGIYNEFLRGELEPHRKVFEVLGSKTKCEPTPDQLSGVGFSSTRGDKVIAIADGRTYELEF